MRELELKLYCSIQINNVNQASHELKKTMLKEQICNAKSNNVSESESAI